jgi:hypothetical protein
MIKPYYTRLIRKKLDNNNDTNNNINVVEKDEFRLIKPIKLLNEHAIRLKDKKLTTLNNT